MKTTVKTVCLTVLFGSFAILAVGLATNQLELVMFPASFLIAVTLGALMGRGEI